MTTQMAASVALLLAAASCSLCAERPLLDYSCDPEAVAEALRSRRAGDAELIAAIDASDRLSSANDAAESSADQLFRLHATTGDAEARERAVAILGALAGPWASATDDELRAQITEGGAQDASNVAMRDLAWDLARLYRLTGDAAMAHRTAIIL